MEKLDLEIFYILAARGWIPVNIYDYYFENTRIVTRFVIALNYY